MIVENLLNPIFGLIEILIGLMPQNQNVVNDVSGFFELLSKGLAIFPADVWGAFLASVIFWNSAQFAWVIVEWVYKKIPGVD